jgi:hypothetical protein
MNLMAKICKFVIKMDLLLRENCNEWIFYKVLIKLLTMLKHLEGSWRRGLEQDLKASHWNLLRCWEKTELEAKFICLKGDDWLSTIYIYTIIIIKKPMKNTEIEVLYI